MSRTSFALVLAWVCACTGEEMPPQTSPDPAAEPTSDAVTEPGSEPFDPGPYPICRGDGGPGFPPDLGAMCAMGSNEDTCLDSQASEQCSTGECLWHANDPANVRSYCTVTCDPADASTCPSGYQCMPDDCYGTSVCMRSEAPGGGNDGPRATLVATDLFSVDTYVFWLGSTSEGMVTLSNTMGEIVRVHPDGEVEHPGDLPDPAVADGLQDGDRTLLFPTDENLIVSVSGRTEIRDFFGTGRTVAGGFRSSDGTIYYLARRDGRTELVPLGDGLDDSETHSVVDLTDAALVPISMTPLRDHGFAAICDDGVGEVLCAGRDGTDTFVLPEPPFTNRGITNTELWGSPNPDELWAENTEELVHRATDQWVMEHFDDRYYDPHGIVPLDSGAALAFVREEGDGKFDVLYLHDGCWEPLRARGPSGALPFDGMGRSTGLLREGTAGWVDAEGNLWSMSVDAR